MGRAGYGGRGHSRGRDTIAERKTAATDGPGAGSRVGIAVIAVLIGHCHRNRTAGDRIFPGTGGRICNQITQCIGQAAGVSNVITANMAVAAGAGRRGGKCCSAGHSGSRTRISIDVTCQRIRQTGQACQTIAVDAGHRAGGDEERGLLAINRVRSRAQGCGVMGGALIAVVAEITGSNQSGKPRAARD